MANHETKEMKTLKKIAEQIVRLDETLEKLAETDADEHKVKHFVEQEKAVMEIRGIVRKSKHFAHLVEKEEAKKELAVAADQALEVKTIKDILDRFDKLDASLAKLDEDSNRVKSYFEQRKAIHEVKRILHDVKMYDAFVQDELEHL